MRILIAGTSWVATIARRDIVSLWAKLNLHLNHDCDILIVDSPGAYDPAQFIEDERIKHFRFGDNIGHLSLGGGDGYGRAFCKSLEIAIEQEYDYVISTDSDILCARPIRPICERMAKTGVKIAAPLERNYMFVENGLVFADVRWLKESRFVERYDWEHFAGILPELHFEKIAGDDLWLLPLRGLRNDQNQITWQNFSTVMSYGFDTLTHCSDFSLYAKFLKRNGINLP